jgi:hypothetical protein
VYDFAYAPQCKYWALLLDRPELAGTAEEYLPSKKRQMDGFVHITQNPVDEQSWQAVPFPKGSEAAYSYVSFIGDDLFFAQERVVWVLQNITALALASVTPDSWRQLFTVEESGEWRSHLNSPYVLKTGNGANYIGMCGKLHLWQNGECRAIEPVLRLGHRGYYAATSCECGIVYVDQEIRLVELDVQSGRERVRPLGYTTGWVTMHDIGGGWMAFLPNGTPGGVPVALFWNMNTDEWLPLFKSALDGSAIRKIVPYAEDSVLIYTFGHRLYRVFDLIGQARILRGKKQAQIGEWSDDPEEGSSAWFDSAFEAELDLTNVRKIQHFKDGTAMFNSNEGIFQVVRASGLWNKIHAQRKAKRPAHDQKVFGDGSFDYLVYRMRTFNDWDLYRRFPSEETARKSVRELLVSWAMRIMGHKP